MNKIKSQKVKLSLELKRQDRQEKENLQSTQNLSFLILLLQSIHQFCIMKIEDLDLKSLKSNNEQFQQNFETGYSCFSRRFFLYHYLQYLIFAKNVIGENFQKNEGDIKLEQLKQIRSQDDSVKLSKSIAKKIDERMMKTEVQARDFDQYDLMSILASAFKPEITLVILLYVIQNSARLIFSILIQMLLERVSDGLYQQAYIFASILVFLWYVAKTASIMAKAETVLINSKLKSSILMLLYAKVSKMSVFGIKKEKLGKVTNLLSNDFSTMEFKIDGFFVLPVIPFALIGATLILYFRLGWPTFVGIFIILLSIPINNCISKKNGQIIKEMNVHKDKRVEICTQIIQSIKLLKLYGWEIAFRKIVQEIREKEIACYKRFGFGKSIERALSNTTIYWAALAMFLLSVYVNDTLTTAKIFSTLEIIGYLKMTMMMFSHSLGFYYELKVILGRNAAIFNIKNKKMVEIDEDTKQIVEKQTKNDDSLSSRFEQILEVEKQSEEIGKRKTINNSYDNLFSKSNSSSVELKDSISSNKIQEIQENQQLEDEDQGETPNIMVNSPDNQKYKILDKTVTRKLFIEQQKDFQEKVPNIICTESLIIDKTVTRKIKVNQSRTIDNNEETSNKISFQNFSGYFSQDFENPSLDDIQIQFQGKKLYGIVGKVASGKSAILAAILQELPFYSGKLTVSGRIAYVEQQPVIFSGTVRDNITFGRSFDIDLYRKATRVSCLESDFILFDDGDLTAIGEKGATLSGGQRARISLARAVYSDADIYLLDDPLSAVDSRVGKKIFRNCIKQLCKQKLVLLATHRIGFIKDCDRAIIMEAGKIKIHGNPQFLEQELDALSFYEKKNHLKKGLQEIDEENQPEEEEEEGKYLSLKLIPVNNDNNSIFTKSFYSQNFGQIKQNQIAVQNKSSSQSQPTQGKKLTKKQQSIEVTWNTYKEYICVNPLNKCFFPFTVFMFFAAEGITSAFLRFLSDYDNVVENNSDMFSSKDILWIVVAVFMGVYFVFQILKYYMLYVSILMANESLHEKMMNGLLRSPASFFDVTPSGQIISKFSNDIGILDNNLTFSLLDTLQGPSIAIVYIISISTINIYFIPAAIVIIILMIMFFRYSSQPIIATKQLELKQKSPLFNHFNEMMSGIIQITIHKRRKQFLELFSRVTNDSIRTSIGFDFVSRGFGYYVSLLCLLFIAVGFEIGILVSTPQTAGLYGVTVVLLMQFCDFLQWSLRQIINTKAMIVSTERCFFIANQGSQKELVTPYDAEIGLSEEVQAFNKDEDLHTQWPPVPSINLEKLSVKYREDLPMVLNNLAFNVESGQRVGIVGRTGAGKSSITQALFRLIEAQQDSTYQIGGFNALQMGLLSLRQHISIIPQTPFIFKGTIKQNMDPFGTSTEEDIWKSLHDAGLQDLVSSLNQKLETEVGHSSDVFSTGQKQLLCLARALLRRNKILVLDEATSNVDMHTDEFIQNVIKEKFKHTTIISIAHRLDTIADYDKIVVMDQGSVAEQGHPYELIKKKGIFYDMVKHSGAQKEKIKSRAKKSYENKKNQ